MSFNYLAVVIPVKWLPLNPEQARTQAWAAVTQLLLPNLGKFYSRFYPANQPWGQDIAAPYSVVLRWENPFTFLNLFYRAKKKQDEAAAFHSLEMLSNISPERMQRIGDTLICHVTADGSSEALTAHALWHTAVTSGVPMLDCGIYYLEHKKAMLSLEQEKAVSGCPAGYALCAVVLEEMEVSA